MSCVLDQLLGWLKSGGERHDGFGVGGDGHHRVAAAVLPELVEGEGAGVHLIVVGAVGEPLELGDEGLGPWCVVGDDELPLLV